MMCTAVDRATCMAQAVRVLTVMIVLWSLPGHCDTSMIDNGSACPETGGIWTGDTCDPCACGGSAEPLPGRVPGDLEEWLGVGIDMRSLNIQPTGGAAPAGFRQPVFDLNVYRGHCQCSGVNGSYAAPVGVQVDTMSSCTNAVSVESFATAEEYGATLQTLLATAGEASTTYGEYSTAAAFTGNPEMHRIRDLMGGSDEPSSTGLWMSAKAECPAYRAALGALSENSAYFSSGFKARIEALPTPYDEKFKRAYLNIFRDYGTHVSVIVVAGAVQGYEFELVPEAEGSFDAPVSLETAANVASGLAMFQSVDESYGLTLDQALDVGRAFKDVIQQRWEYRYGIDQYGPWQNMTSSPKPIKVGVVLVTDVMSSAFGADVSMTSKVLDLKRALDEYIANGDDMDPGSDGPGRCRVENFNGYGYLTCDTAGITYEAAAEECKNAGMALVEVEDNTENDYIAGRVLKQLRCKSRAERGGTMWIGGPRWAWPADSTFPGTPNKVWASDEPDGTWEDGIVMQVACPAQEVPEYGWKDEDKQSQQNGYVCKGAQVNSNITECVSGQLGDKEYQVCTATWTDRTSAKEQCREKGMSLALINSEEANTYIVDMILGQWGCLGRFWLGNEAQAWANGATFPGTDVPVWQSDQPDNNQGVETGVDILYKCETEPYGWNDAFPGATLAGFVCESS